MKARALSKLSVGDLMKFPVWEMAEDDGGDPVVKPARGLPVQSLRNRLVGAQIQLADGSREWALLGNVSINNPLSTRHFLTMSVHKNGKWFDLARYHDVDYVRRNESALARFLAKPVEQVFPLQFDITALATGSSEALVGQVPSSPAERLHEDELIRLSLEAE